jgi:hypothetical protein
VTDLSRYLKTVKVDADARLAYVGGGAIWNDVNDEAGKYGLATPGGTVGVVCFPYKLCRIIGRCISANANGVDWRWRVSPTAP